MIRTLIAVTVLVALVGCGPQLHKSTYVYDSQHQFGTYDVYRAADAHGVQPAVVFFHGGGFMTGSKDDGRVFAESLCRSGLTLVSVDYSLTTTGPQWPAQIDDARAALRHVQEHAGALGIAPKVAVMGSSAGAMLALLTHLTDDPGGGQRPTCCVDISGETDLTLCRGCFSDWDRITTQLLGERRDDIAFLSSISAVNHARQDASVLIIHSTSDSNVYVVNSDEMSEALLRVGADVRYCRYTGFAHGDDVFTSCKPARDEIATFLHQRLTP